jgi:hypothetical protein
MEVLKSVLINILLKFIGHCLFLEGHRERVYIHVTAQEKPGMLLNHYHCVWVKVATSKINTKKKFQKAQLTINVAFTVY